MPLFNSRIVTALNVFVLATASVVVFGGAQNDVEKTFSDATMDLGIVVSDLDESVRFYTQVVGLEKTGGFAVGQGFCRDAGLTDGYDLDIQVLSPNGDSEGTSVKLMELPGVDSRKGDHRFIHSQLGYSYLTFHVTDIDAASRRMKMAGIKALGNEQIRVPLDTPVPIFLTVIADPDGNLIELVGPKAK
ncbi:MAG: VOC family protein [Fuerstiella sp.]|nr:VOC family protein [Fuerstiella sp.]